MADTLNTLKDRQAAAQKMLRERLQPAEKAAAKMLRSLAAMAPLEMKLAELTAQIKDGVGTLKQLGFEMKEISELVGVDSRKLEAMLKTKTVAPLRTQTEGIVADVSEDAPPVSESSIDTSSSMSGGF